MPEAESDPRVPPLALAEVEADLPWLKARAARAGWGWTFDPETLTLNVKFTRDTSNETYLLRGVFDQFRSLPPIWDFVDLDIGEVGTRSAYPKQVGSTDNPNRIAPIFIESGTKGQLICLPCNRLAYRELDPRAPHGDWQLVNWTQLDPKYPTVEEMVSRIAQDIQLSKGRWAPRPSAG